MSDIRKIQTGNNQYTLHARVSDKLAVSAQIGSPTKPVYVDSSGEVRACSRDIPTVDTAISNSSTNPIQNKTVFDALKLKADAAALGAYQPKYNADYVAASDFDYSELPNDITTIDLNGYTMNVSVDNTIVHGYCYNGSINVTSNQVTLDGSCNNVSIYSEDAAFCKNGEGVTFTNCNLVQITIDVDCECENSHISSCVIKSFYVIKSSLLGGCTFVVPNDDEGNIVNSVIDGVLYHKCAIKNNKPIETGYESNIASPSVSGNAPSCEAVKTALQLKADKTQLNSLATKTELNGKADVSVLGAYQPKYKADYIATSDLTALPITAGVLDLNGYTLTLSGTTELTGTLTIKNGTIGGEGTLKNDLLISINDCQLIKNSKITLSCFFSLLDDIHVTDLSGNFFVFNTGEDCYATISPSSYCRITNFSGITIEGTNIELDIIAQNGTNLLVKNAKIKVLDVVAVEFQGKFDAEIYNCYAVILESSNVDKSSTYTVVSSNISRDTGSGVATSFIRYGTKDKNGVLQDLLKPTSTIDEDKYSVVSPKAVYDYLKDYAKKSDISAVYKYKGSVNKVSDLPNPSNLTESNAGDVYNIGTASTSNNITVKSGDNVAWVWDKTKNAGHWDNLSGTVDLSNYLQKGGKQTTTSTADGGSNVYTFKDGSTITVKNGSKGSTGAAATWFSGGAVTGTSTTAKTFTVSGSKAGDMYLNTGTSNVYKATAANQWVYLCNIKGPQGTPGNNGTTPTINAAAGSNVGAVGTPSVTANTSGTTTTFTFNNLKGQKGDTGATVTWHTGTAVTGTAATVAGAKTGDMYLNTKTYNVYKSTGTNKWVGVCNIKGAKGDAADIPKLAKGVAGIVPGTTNDSLNASRWLNGGKNGTGAWSPLPTAGGDTSGMVRTCKDYTSNAANPVGYGHGSTPPTIQPLTSGANDYRGVECDKQGMLFVNVPAYEKNINRAQNTVLAAPTTGTGTATFRKLTTSDIPWGDKLKVVTESQFNSTTPTAGVFYFVLEE